MNCCLPACRLCRARRVRQDAAELADLLRLRDLDEFAAKLLGMCEEHLDVLCRRLDVPIYKKEEPWASRPAASFGAGM